MGTVRMTKKSWVQLGWTMGWLLEAYGQRSPDVNNSSMTVDELLEKAWHDFEIYLCKKGLLGTRVQLRLDIEHEKTGGMSALEKIDYLYRLMGLKAPIVR